MNEWWRESAWMIVDGVGYVNPATTVERLPDGRARLTAHKVRGYSVTVAAGSPVADEVGQR